MQTPGDSSAVHVMQPALQAVLQQTPSTQLPLAHWLAHAHAWPLVRPLAPASHEPPTEPSMRTSPPASPSRASGIPASRAPPDFPQPATAATSMISPIAASHPGRPPPADNQHSFIFWRPTPLFFY
jgi:hypothetical protein